MLNINVDQNGDINVSVEPLNERIAMLHQYAKVDENQGSTVVNNFASAPVDQTAQDERDQTLFRQGWDSAINESKLWYVQGKIEDFWNSLEPVPETGLDASDDDRNFQDDPDFEDNWDAAEADVNEALAEYQATHADEPYEPVPAVIAQDPAITPVADSGEPELETQNQTWDPANDGTWTMSAEELQSRLDETFARGYNDGEAAGYTRPHQTTANALAMIGKETYEFVFPSAPELEVEDMTKFMKALGKRLGFEVSE